MLAAADRVLAACSQLVSLWMKKSSPHLLDDDADRTTRWSRAIKQVRLQTRVAAAASSSKSPRTPGSAFRDGIRRGSVASVASAARRLSVFSGLSRGRSRGVSDACEHPGVGCPRQINFGRFRLPEGRPAGPLAGFQGIFCAF